MESTQFIVVHAGRRDDYQVALALSETDRLHCFVTDFYAPLDTWYGKLLIKNRRVREILTKRYKKGVVSPKVKVSYQAVVYTLLYFLTKNVRFSSLKDDALGRLANKISRRNNIPIISMNTYAGEAFNNINIEPRILFQFHPHPLFVKTLLEDEINIHPGAKDSILKEYEFSLGASELSRLSNEINLATNYVCASTVTKKSLLKQGIEDNKIKVIPYGVETSRFPYINRTNGPTFKVLFIGSLNQRKGIIYLLEALRLMPHIELLLVGRGIFDYELIKDYPFKITVHRDIPHEQLITVMHEANCFVLPSVIEGFGQVILEAMATGLPVIASENTAAKDIIRCGYDGFTIPIRDSVAIADALRLLIGDPALANKMGQNAADTAKKYTWQRFRKEFINYLDKVTPLNTGIK